MRGHAGEMSSVKRHKLGTCSKQAKAVFTIFTQFRAIAYLRRAGTRASELDRIGLRDERHNDVIFRYGPGERHNGQGSHDWDKLELEVNEGACTGKTAIPRR
jgi:hypothetical protein